MLMRMMVMIAVTVFRALYYQSIASAANQNKLRQHDGVVTPHWQ